MNVAMQDSSPRLLSVPSLRGMVQHECDHLQGILYPMRITDFRLFGFTGVLFPGQAPMDE